MDDKKKAIQNKDDFIQRLERNENDRGDKNLDSKSHIDMSPDYQMGDHYPGDSNQNKLRLKDYDEAFRRIYVMNTNLKQAKSLIGSHRCN